jgi:putative ABC transport system permease protein
MTAALHLALRYVLRHRVQSLLLASALGLVVALPLCLRVLVRHAQAELRSRAASTPQIVGTRGSALDLMMTALYFKKENLASLPLKEVPQGGIPLHVRFEAQGAPIVGTALEYFPFRGLSVEAGKQITRLGDCVVGARLARERGLKPGDAVFSTPEQTFDMAGTYPLKMRVTGILTANGTPDDDAVFCDLKTAWLIEGRAHGHDDVKGTDVLKEEDHNTVANAAHVPGGHGGEFELFPLPRRHRRLPGERCHRGATGCENGGADGRRLCAVENRPAHPSSR